MRVVHNSPKSLTVLADDGHTETRVSFTTTAYYCYTKNGGLTVWGDGRSASETVRFLPNGKVKPVRIKRRKR